jgi:hypothetical protein
MYCYPKEIYIGYTSQTIGEDMEDYQIGICSLFLSVLSSNMFMDVIGRI